MMFRTWIETLNRDAAREIVLNAAGAAKIPMGQRQIVLGSKVSEQPKLLNNLQKFSELQPHMPMISDYISTHPNSNLVQLIDFIGQLDHLAI